jgi:hypothetical protein
MKRKWTNIYRDQDGDIWYGCGHESREDALRNSKSVRSKTIGRFSYICKK